MKDFLSIKNSIGRRLISNIIPKIQMLIVLVTVICLASVTAVYSQGTANNLSPGNAPGAPTGSYSMSGFENVNLYGGNLNFDLPIISINGRGTSGTALSLKIDNQWNISTYYGNEPVGNQGNEDNVPHYMPTLNSWNPFNTISSYSRGPATVVYDYQHFSGNKEVVSVILTKIDGTQIRLIDKLTQGNPEYVNPSSIDGFYLVGKEFNSVDSSNVTFISDTDIYKGQVTNGDVDQQYNGFATGYLLLPDGSRQRVENGLIKLSEDRNGNQTKFEYTTFPNTYIQKLTKITDSLNRETTIEYGVSEPEPYGLCDKITLKGFGGADRVIRISYRKLATDNLLKSGLTSKTLRQLFPLDDSPMFFKPGVVGGDPGHGYSQSGVWVVNDDIVDPLLPAALWMPDGRAYKFKYDNYASLARVELPTGGAIEYDWSAAIKNFLQNVNINDVTVQGPSISRRVVERRTYNSNNVLENRSTYSRPVSCSSFNSSTYNCNGRSGESSPLPSDPYVQVDVLKADGGLINRTNHYFYGIGDAIRYNYLYAYSDWREGKEYKTDVFDSDGATLLRRSEQAWNQPTTPSWFVPNQTYCPYGTEGNLPCAVPTYFPRIDEVKNTLADTNQVSKTTFGYDQYLNVTDKYEYDFGSGSSGAFLRKTHTDYITNSNYTDGTITRLRNLPSQIWVSSDQAGNNKVSLSQMEYDNYASDTNHAPLVDRANVSGFDSANYGTANTVRGNVTAMTSYANAAAQNEPVTAYSQYDILGNVVKTIDSKGNASTINYDDNFGAPDGEARTSSAPAQLNGQQTFAFATSATNSANFTTHVQFDYFTGSDVDVESINSTISSSFYNDPLDRPTQTIGANNIPSLRQQTTIAYDDANHKVTTTSDLNSFGDNSVKSESFYDGLGRTTESRKYETGGGYVAINMEYDALNRVKRVTNPYRPAQSEPQLWTTSVYDSLGRVTSVTTPDNAVVQTSYSGNAVTMTDQAGKQRRSITNGIGELTRVDEPDDAGNLGSIDAPVQPTSYLYDVPGRMVKVTQGVQSRYFKYDDLGRLLRVKQPEQGVNASLSLADSATGNSDWSAGFTYDANGNLLTATDTKGTVITSAYDNLNRVTSRSYSDATPQVTFTYDDPSVQFSKGKLTKTASSVSVSQILSMDNLGRVLSSRQTTDGTNYDSAYSYNLAGGLIEETYPSGRKVKNTFQSDGDLSKIETMQSGGSYQTRADNFAYAPQGAISQLHLGNNLWETAQFNNRLQVTQLGLGTSASDQSVWKLNYDFGTTDNNGNIKAQVVTSPAGTFNQSFTYDSLNRLKTAQETSGGNQTWSQTFSYDRYGNRTGFSQTLDGQTTNSTPTIDANTNRFNLGQGYTYDLAGNVIIDAQGRQFTFNGDNKQTQVKDANSNIIGTYSYDGDGKRIKKVTPTEITVFVYSDDTLIAEYTNSIATPQTPTTQYLGTDMLGSPRVVTDQNAQVVSRRDFLPFGEDLQRANYGTDTIRQKFTGYQRDNETNLDFAEARYYNSQIGRFTAIDPLLASGQSADPQTFNRYAYAMNKPTNLTDPFGMQAGTAPIGQNLSPCNSEEGSGQQCDGYLNNGVANFFAPIATVNIVYDSSQQIIETFTPTIQSAIVTFAENNGSDLILGQTNINHTPGGRLLGNTASIVQGLAEITSGSGMIGGGGGEAILTSPLCTTVVGCAAPAVGVGGIVIGGTLVTHGGAVITNTILHMTNDPNPPNSTTEPTLPEKTIVEEDGVTIEHNYKSNDHGFAHAHVVENGKTATRIGPNGKPYRSDPQLTMRQSRVVQNNRQTIRRAINKIGRWLQYHDRK